MTDRCPTAPELASAFSNGPSDALREHVSSCARCAGAWAATERVVNSYRTLPWQDSSPRRVEEQRTALLASAALAKPATARRWVRWAVPVVAAAAVGLIVVARLAPTAVPELPFHGSLTAHGEAVFNRISARPDELVTLTTGTLSVEVSPLAPGERFRIATTDAEVEVRGTAFEVTADHGRLVMVHVRHGRVEVRPIVGGAVVLGAGESWSRPTVTANVTASMPTGETLPPSPHVPTADPTRSPRTPADEGSARGRAKKDAGHREASIAQPPVVNEVRAPDRVADVSALAYQEAWSALRAGDHTSAAKGFERAATIAPRSGLAEDAWYWRAVSLARARQTAEARGAFAAFLESYPSSPRAPQASAMLGWLLFDAGDLDGAETRFRAAADDLAPAVRDSALQGLDAVRRQRSER